MKWLLNLSGEISQFTGLDLALLETSFFISDHIFFGSVASQWPKNQKNQQMQKLSELMGVTDIFIGKSVFAILCIMIFISHVRG